MAEDYEKLGLMCGIEIHQQLEGKKLFCNCPTIIDDNSADMQVHRRLRAVVGETGEIDAAALQEQERAKVFTYDYYKKSCCLVELDEEPPRPINKDAVETSYVVAKLLEAKIVDEVHVMRKTVVDGSNTTGFQRTALVAMNGIVRTKFGDVGVESICLEEDAAKIVNRKNGSDRYNLTRLGIPLVEIATAPDMRNPEEVKDAAEKIGLILRSTGKCKRGLGTIRQDVNVSIKEGERVEIKGAQDLKMIPTIVDEEVQRQKNLIEIKKELGDINITSKIVDLTKIFEKTEGKVIRKALDKKGVVLGIKLPGFKGYLGREIQVGRRLGSELSDYAKVKAGVGGLFHCDELPKYGITEDEVKSIIEVLGVKGNDGYVIVADDNSKAELALQAVVDRANLIPGGIIKEVRKANPNGSSSYMRPMPGGARMYPETDVMPLVMHFEDVELPELIDDKAIRYQSDLKLSRDLGMDIAKSEYNALFEEMLSNNKKVKPAFIAETLVAFVAELTRDHKGANPELVTDDILRDIFAALNASEIAKESVMKIIVDISMGKEFNPESYKTISEAELDKGIQEVVAKNEGAPMGAVMGQVMKIYRGKADGQLVSKLVQKYMKK